MKSHQQFSDSDPQFLKFPRERCPGKRGWGHMILEAFTTELSQGSSALVKFTSGVLFVTSI